MNFIYAAEQFALTEIAPSAVPDFRAILGKAGAAGLCGIGLPESYGGPGGGSVEAVNAVRAMARAGGNAGIAFSYSYHLAVSRFLVHDFGTGEQRRKYLPGLAQAHITAGLAVSEPGTGAHPKHLNATAEKQGDSFVINGEKTYLTNGPVVDVFIFIAATSTEAGRKRFTAFLVPADSQEIARSPLEFGWLESSPHCGIAIKDLKLAGTEVLGNFGKAYEEIVIPFRAIEDTMISGLILGGLERRFGNFLARAKGSSQLAPEAGRLDALLCSMEALSLKAAELLEAGGHLRADRELEALCFSFRKMARDFEKTMSETAGQGSPGKLAIDISKLVDLGKRVSLIRQAKVGEALLRKGNANVQER